MRNRSEEAKEEKREGLSSLLELIQENTGLSAVEAYLFHLEMWLYVHGIATMIATSYLDWEMKLVSKTLSDIYIGLEYRYCGEVKENGNT